jgi:putative spermidine/putrescine transport system permease protein
MASTVMNSLGGAPGRSSRPFLSPRRVGILLWLPLFLFLGATFFAPLLGMLRMSVQDTELAAAMPQTVSALAQWDGQVPPPDHIYEAVATDLLAARRDRSGGTIARRLNLEVAGLQSVVNLTVRRLPERVDHPSLWRAAFSQLDTAWDSPAVWHALERSRGPRTDLHLLSGFDLQRRDDGAIHRKPPTESLYVDVLLRTFAIALSATLICLLLALPTAALLVRVGPTVRGLMMMALLLPLWTSVLVRSASWLVLLQKNGLVNQWLMGLGLIAEPLALIYNRTGVLISLVHVLLPYAVLPIFSSMKSMSPTQMRAASSLGAGPFTAFHRVYLPQILPGISAGGLLVFILALGYYVTPLLLGGPSDQLLPFYIAFNAVQTVNWGLAAALGAILLAATVALYTAYVRLVGVHRIGLG